MMLRFHLHELYFADRAENQVLFSFLLSER